MTAANQAARFDCVIFDCDGVLVDSEPIVHRVLNRVLNELGIEITLEESMKWFLGRAVRDELGNIEARLGKPLPRNFLSEWFVRRDAALIEELEAVPHIRQTIEAIKARGLPVCVASGADRIKVKLQLTHTDLLGLFVDPQDQREHIFSATEVEHSKPAPDVYLLAARTMGVEPSRCAVVEDSPTGATAGVAAGMTVFGYAARTDADELRAVGVKSIFTDMRDLPELIA
ncbi:MULTISPECIES: HAD family phosphatase [unclassified Cupriavidus]|jgi:beta-phosphoglucomutase-like phosphatase (HAD superfamily)|uniref:HAD family hydrolase n=1 Tax=unclassified Cupriavidus TaxID=2640874 RepID=UPI001C0005F0|nr:MULTISPECIES: HAD family phosphatase [unclassified Cupriavidus]MCA3190586.1 HAD family phosphatase [Cupriavidus sp.]MCA3197291.1 HAD family phosphatase [Cupriavidus sp.]MCA3202568.1 HAD family phosphatase [Cupriavidus sp.]MCA3209565.1 HAD family phosphatase [Cupriavidus sp.]MCA3231959.1 HAD family phosphatase [Cupriavidus sp.]